MVKKKEMWLIIRGKREEWMGARARANVDAVAIQFVIDQFRESEYVTLASSLADCEV